MRLFKNPPPIEFSDTQRQQLFAHARKILWDSLLFSALFALVLYLLGDGLQLILLKASFAPVILLASLGMRIVWPKRAEDNLPMWLAGKLLVAISTSCMFLVIMINPDKSVSELLVMFGVFFGVSFLISLVGWSYDEPGSARRELPLS